MTGYVSKRAARDKMAQPAQEPVGVVCVDTSHAHIVYGSQYLGRQPDKKTAMFFKDCEVGEQLYTFPPQRPWVGLTDEDWKEIEDMPDTFDQGVSWCLAKLKEKNTSKNNAVAAIGAMLGSRG